MLIQLDEKREKNLTPSERCVVDFINQNGTKAMDMSVRDLAEAAYVSSATVSRAIRKCGYTNLAELRIRLSDQSQAASQPGMINEILQKSYDECVKTIENIRVPDVLTVTQHLKEARRIYIIACGSTALVAHEFEFQLNCLGYNVYVLSDAQIMRKIDRIISPEDVALIFTVNNSTVELAIAAELAHSKGAFIATCCCKEGTPLEDFSDVVIYGYSQYISPNKELGCTSHVGLLVIMRTLVEYLGKN